MALRLSKGEFEKLGRRAQKLPQMKPTGVPMTLVPQSTGLGGRHYVADCPRCGVTILGHAWLLMKVVMTGECPHFRLMFEDRIQGRVALFWSPGYYPEHLIPREGKK